MTDQPLRDLAQQIVARLDAEGLVHLGECLEVKQQQGKARIVPNAELDRAFASVLQEHAVGQPGQGIVGAIAMAA